MKKYLDDIYSKTNIKNKKVKIRYISAIDEIKNSHLLFILKQEKELSKILAYTQDKPILTISDTNGFSEKGTHINFYLIKKKVKIEINLEAVKKSGLKMSYLLLNLAKIKKYKGE